MGRLKGNLLKSITASSEFRKKLLLSIFSGLLLAVIFPRLNLEFFAWFALVPLLILINKSKGFKDSFFYGFLTGIVSYVIILYWIAYTVRVFGGLPLYVSIFALLLLSGYLAIFIGLFAVFSKIIMQNFKRLSLLLVPSCWVFFEFIKSNLLTGFPWENLGFSQYLNIPFIQVSNIIGTLGLSFIIVLVNYAVFRFLFMHRDISGKQAFVEFAAVLSILVIVESYGYYNIYSIRRSLENKHALKVALIQGNVGMFQKWKLTKQRTTDLYLGLTRKALKYSPSLVIWPETALPYIISVQPYYWNRVMSFVKANKINLIFGSIGVNLLNGKYRFYNRDYMFTKNGRYSYYDKMHLVPFGEYIPLRKTFPFIAHLLRGAGIGNFTRGSDFRILKSGRIMVGSMICYEAYFDSLVRNFPDKGANLLVSITDDAWYGKSSAPYQDMSMTVFSAVENDRFVARAGNSGISGIISPTGRIIRQTGIFDRTFILGNVKLINKKTFFTIYGNIFAYIAMGLFCFSLFYLVFLKKNNL